MMLPLCLGPQCFLLVSLSLLLSMWQLILQAFSMWLGLFTASWSQSGQFSLHCRWFLRLYIPNKREKRCQFNCKPGPELALCYFPVSSSSKSSDSRRKREREKDYSSCWEDGTGTVHKSM